MSSYQDTSQSPTPYTGQYPIDPSPNLASSTEFHTNPSPPTKSFSSFFQPSQSSHSSHSPALQQSSSSGSSMSLLGTMMNRAAAAAVSVAAGGVSYISPTSVSQSTRTPPSKTIHEPSQESSITSEDFVSSVHSPIGASIPQLIASRKYRQTTIIKEGILDKWTNYVGAWRARYFIIEPGILKYANAPGQPIKETFPLVLCSTRFCPGDPLRLEVEHPHGVLYLRMPCGNEKRSWIEALLKAKNIFQQSTNGITRGVTQSCLRDIGSRSEPVGILSSSALASVDSFNLDATEAQIDKYLNRRREGDEVSVSDSRDEKSPMVCLMENCVNCRQSLQSARSNIRRLQAEMLRLAGRVKDQQFREDARNLSVHLVERLDLIQMIMSRHLVGSETLAAEERAQRKVLEKSLRTIAKRNYRMKMRLHKLQRLFSEENREQKVIPIDEDQQQRVSTSESEIKFSSNLPSREVLNHEEGIRDQGPRLSTGSLESVETTTMGPITPSASDALSRKIERKRQIVSILAGDFTSDEDEEIEASSESEAEVSSAGRVLDDDEDGDEFYDIEEMPVGNGTHETGVSIPTFASTLEEGINPSFSLSSSIAPIVRRTELPKPRAEFKVSLWSILKDCIGRDLSTISMPVYFNEPTSFLQRLAEDFQYASLLKEASHYSSSVDRLLWVVLFTISPYSSTIGRTYKPFNPLLGETFELSHRGFKFLAEQVGHHPPVTAYHASAHEFEAYGHMTVKNRFTGKSLEVTLPGVSNIVLNVEPMEKISILNDPSTNNAVNRDHFTFQRAKAIVNNVIFGKLTLELFGHVLITSHTCGTCAFVEYLRRGWWSNEMHVVRGILFDANGNPRLRIGGWWNREIWVETLEPYDNPGVFPIIPAKDVVPSEDHGLHNPIDHYQGPKIPSGNPLISSESDCEAQMKRIEENAPFDPQNSCYCSRDSTTIKITWDALKSIPGTRRVLWRPEPRPPHSSQYYEFGHLTMELNELSADYDVRRGASIPPTDSRYRPDQRWLEFGETVKANEEKTRMEEKQRAAARLRIRGEEDYKARWFERNRKSGHSIWDFTGEYWIAKEAHQFVHCMDIF